MAQVNAHIAFLLTAGGHKYCVEILLLANGNFVDLEFDLQVLEDIDLDLVLLPLRVQALDYILELYVAWFVVESRLLVTDSAWFHLLVVFVLLKGNFFYFFFVILLNQIYPFLFYLSFYLSKLISRIKTNNNKFQNHHQKIIPTHSLH